MKTFICPACRGPLIDVVAGYCNTCRRTTVQTGVPRGLYLVRETTPDPTSQQRKCDVFLAYSIGFAQ